MPENSSLHGPNHSPEQPHRRRRYERASSQSIFVSLTPTKVSILRFLSELRFLSLPQIARLCCPSSRPDLSEKNARRQMRSLFDAGLVDVLPVSRAALAPLDAANDASLLYGSAPNIYALTAFGQETVRKAGIAGSQNLDRKKPAYGPKNSLFLAHELAVRDVRVWLETLSEPSGLELECWRDGETAGISLPNGHMPSSNGSVPYSVRPDAWFALRIKQAVLVGLVEVDRGTERGDRRWREKLESYAALYAMGDLTSVTGYRNARVLVFCSSERRRDQVSAIIDAVERPLASRFWITDLTTLRQPSLLATRWRQPDGTLLKPLIPG